MRATPRCAVHLQEHLEELQKKEDLEMLRTPLRENRLFPTGRDPDTAIITNEELKKLVRFWKLHEIRGFWKTHVSKEELVKALLDHMSTQEQYDYLFQARFNPGGAGSGGGTGAAGGPGGPGGPGAGSPGSPGSPTPYSPRHPRGTRSRNSPRKFVLKQIRTNGSAAQMADGLVYLSRIGFDEQIKPKELGSLLLDTSIGGSSLKDGRDDSLVGDETLDGDESFEQELSMDSGDEESDAATISGAAMAKKRIMSQQLLEYTTVEGKQEEIVRQGGLRAIMDLIHLDDAVMNENCAAALSNIARSPATRLALVEHGIVSLVTRMLNTTPNSEAVMYSCCLLLYYLSCEGDEDRMLFGGFFLQALQSCENSVVGGFASRDEDDNDAEDSDPDSSRAAAALLNGDDERKDGSSRYNDGNDTLGGGNSVQHQIQLLHLTTMTNLMPGMDRSRLTEMILNLLKRKPYIANEQLIPVSVRALENMSFFDSLHFSLADLEILRVARQLMDAAGTDEPTMLCLANVISNLAGTPEIHGSLVNQGIIELTGILCRSTSKRVKTACARVIATLVPNMDLAGLIVAQGVCNILVTLARSMNDEESRTVLCTALSSLSVTAGDLTVLVKQGVHETLIGYADPNSTPKLRARALAGLCNLLAEDGNRTALVSEVARVIERVSPRDGEQVKKLAGMCLFNLACEPSCGHYLIEHEVFMPLFELAVSSNAGLQTISVDALFSLASDLKSCQVLAGRGLLRTLQRAASHPECSERIRFTIAAILLSFAKHSAEFEFEQLREIVAVLQHIAESTNLEVQQRCSGVMCALSKYHGLTGDLMPVLRLLQQTMEDDEVTYNCARTLFNISCDESSAVGIISEASVLKRLIGAMRGGQGETQMCSAKALCNLSCYPSCAEILLDQGVVGDFVVIAILRTNNVLIKVICAKTFFNLMEHQSTRDRMIQAGVLWALIKLSHLDHETTRFVCAKTMYNLSLSSSLCEQLRELKAVQSLAGIASVGEQETRSFSLRAAHMIASVALDSWYKPVGLGTSGSFTPASAGASRVYSRDDVPSPSSGGRSTPAGRRSSASRTAAASTPRQASAGNIFGQQAGSDAGASPVPDGPTLSDSERRAMVAICASGADQFTDEEIGLAAEALLMATQAPDEEECSSLVDAGIFSSLARITARLETTPHNVSVIVTAVENVCRQLPRKRRVPDSVTVEVFNFLLNYIEEWAGRTPPPTSQRQQSGRRSANNGASDSKTINAALDDGDDEENYDDDTFDPEFTIDDDEPDTSVESILISTLSSVFALCANAKTMQVLNDAEIPQRCCDLGLERFQSSDRVYLACLVLLCQLVRFPRGRDVILRSGMIRRIIMHSKGREAGMSGDHIVHLCVELSVIRSFIAEALPAGLITLLQRTQTTASASSRLAGATMALRCSHLLRNLSLLAGVSQQLADSPNMADVLLAVTHAGDEETWRDISVTVYNLARGIDDAKEFSCEGAVDTLTALLRRSTDPDTQHIVCEAFRLITLPPQLAYSNKGTLLGQLVSRVHAESGETGNFSVDAGLSSTSSSNSSNSSAIGSPQRDANGRAVVAYDITDLLTIKPTQTPLQLGRRGSFDAALANVMLTTEQIAALAAQKGSLELADEGKSVQTDTVSEASQADDSKQQGGGAGADAKADAKGGADDADGKDAGEKTADAKGGEAVTPDAKGAAALPPSSSGGTPGGGLGAPGTPVGSGAPGGAAGQEEEASWWCTFPLDLLGLHGICPTRWEADPSWDRFADTDAAEGELASVPTPTQPFTCQTTDTVAQPPHTLPQKIVTDWPQVEDLSMFKSYDTGSAEEKPETA